MVNTDLKREIATSPRSFGTFQAAASEISPRNRTEVKIPHQIDRSRNNNTTEVISNQVSPIAEPWTAQKEFKTRELSQNMIEVIRGESQRNITTKAF